MKVKINAACLRMWMEAYCDNCSTELRAKVNTALAAARFSRNADAELTVSDLEEVRDLAQTVRDSHADCQQKIEDALTAV